MTICDKCKEEITKIVRVYRNQKNDIIRGNTIRAFFNTDGFDEVTYSYAAGMPICEKADHFLSMLDREGWVQISERYIK